MKLSDRIRIMFLISAIAIASSEIGIIIAIRDISKFCSEMNVNVPFNLYLLVLFIIMIYGWIMIYKELDGDENEA